MRFAELVSLLYCRKFLHECVRVESVRFHEFLPNDATEQPGFALVGAFTMVKVFYVRHGQSVWNKEQSEAKAAGESEAAVRKLGDAALTDAPLTTKGVTQALDVRKRLFAKGAAGELAAVVQRAVAVKKMPPPRIYVSNLRRAIDTGLLAFKPLLLDRKAQVISLPAMQETCHYADCVAAADTKAADSSATHFVRRDQRRLVAAGKAGKADRAAGGVEDDEVARRLSRWPSTEEPRC